jgi:hypothetical protein
MTKFLNPVAALKRVLEDPEAPTMARVEALRQIPHPPLLLLRRILVGSATGKVPSRLYAAAALAYSKEVALRQEKRKWKPVVRPRPKIDDGEPVDTQGNSLGI